MPGARRRTRASGPVDELGEVDRLDDVGQRLVTGQLDEVADQGGELLDLGAHVVEQLGPRLRPGGRALAVGLAEQVEVGAQRGERRAQLVAGVGDQLPLAVPGRGERREHLVERGGQAGDLVVALDRQRAQVLGAGDVLDRGGEPADRAQAVAGHPPAREAGADHAGEAEEEHHDAELGEQVLLRVQRLRDHHGAAVVAVHGDHPPPGAVAGDGAHRGVLLVDARPRSRASRSAAASPRGSWRGSGRCRCRRDRRPRRPRPRSSRWGTARSGSHSALVGVESARCTSESSSVDWSCIRTVM